MSAYIVDHNHVWYMIVAGSYYRTFIDSKRRPLSNFTDEEKRDFGQYLLDINIRSVRARCGNSLWYALPGPKDEAEVLPPRTVDWAVIKPVELIKSVNCYEYQSCEDDHWPDSEAYRFCQRLKGAAEHNLQGYEEAEWGYPQPMRAGKES